MERKVSAVPLIDGDLMGSDAWLTVAPDADKADEGQIKGEGEDEDDEF